MKTTDYSAEQLAGMITEMRSALDDLETGAEMRGGDGDDPVRTPTVFQMQKLLRSATRDGYRTSTRPSGSPGTTLDEDGNAMPPISDPTGELAVAEHKVVDPIRFNGESVIRCLTGALGDLRVARASLIRASQHTETYPIEPGCICHALIGSWVPVFRSNRCRWCYDFSLAEHMDPPESLLVIRDSGRSIDQRMVAEAKSKISKRRKPARSR